VNCDGWVLMSHRTQRQLLVGSLVVVVACTRTPADTVEDLRSDDEGTRGSVASWIEDEAASGEEIPREVVDALLWAAPRETEAEAKRDMMRALGRSGDPRAKEVLDAYARSNESPSTASDALQLWMVASGLVSEDHEFPDDWPYGTEGYPPKRE
jgi:hypothetical protein